MCGVWAGPETPTVAEEYALGDESKNKADWGKGAGGGFLGSLPHPRPLQGPYGVTRPPGTALSMSLGCTPATCVGAGVSLCYGGGH